MIDSLQIRNFQAHGRLKIQFAPGVTAIVGPTNCGKSAVMRALIWIVRNKPTGTAFMKHGETSARARITLGELKVARIREKSENCYLLGDESLRAMGADVPGAVISALRIADASIQQQHDSPYMLGLSPRALAEEINRITGCDEVDAVMDAARQVLKDAKAETKVRKADAQKATEALAATRPTESLEADLAAAKQLAERIADIESGSDDLAALLDELHGIEIPEQIEFDFVAADAIRDKAAEASRFINSLATLLELLSRITIPDDVIEPPEINSIAASLKVTKTNIDSLSLLASEIRQVEEEIQAAIAKSEAAAAAFAEVSSDNCPLCGK